MKNIGSLDKFPELRCICQAILGKKANCILPNGTELNTVTFRKGQLYAVDHKGFRYIEQNTASGSHYAERARQGSKIIWVIQTHNKSIDAQGTEYMVPLKNNLWRGRIEDGIVYMN